MTTRENGEMLLGRLSLDEKPRPVLLPRRDDVIARALDLVAMPASRTAHD